MRTRKSWREKLEKVQEPKVVAITSKMRKRFGGGTMLIPRPLDVDAMIRTVKKGDLVTQSEIRNALAGRFHADVTCPITTGIFVRIAAEAAEEDARAGKTLVTPYWRVVRDNGGHAEGHAIDRGRKPRVKDFKKA